MLDLDINPDWCRRRQHRLLDFMSRHDLDWCVLSTIEHIQYFVGPRFHWTFRPLAAINIDGFVVLVAPERRLPEVHAADELIPYEAQWLSTLRNDQSLEVARILTNARPDIRAARKVGVERSMLNARHVAFADNTQFVDIEPEVFRLRRHKDPDELARIRKAIAGTERMYQLARSIVAPGVNELQVFNELQSAAVLEFGEMLTATGNDYQCASRVAPRDRTCQPGELYILDLGPAFRGYFADNARTIAVSEVSDPQPAAWKFISQALAHVESVVVPGKNCRELYEEVRQILAECPWGVFNHHLGHGIGLFPHEAPHLNPNWNDTFEVGDVFTAEPGLYAPELNAGIRIENDYVVTESGVESLTPFPLELKINQ